jgi:hypothetical protein
MRLVDVCIPKFDNDDNVVPTPRNTSHAFQGLFGQKGVDYTVALDENDVGGPENASKSQEQSFFEADEGNVEVCVVQE